MMPLYRLTGRLLLRLLLFNFTVLLTPLYFDAPNCAFALDWALSPSVTVSEQYDSNVRFSSNNPPGVSKSDFLTSIRPVVSITGESEQVKFKFDTATTGLKYVENPRYDTINTDTRTGLTYLWSPRLSTDASAGFIHDWTLEDQLQQSGIQTLKAERYRYDLGLGGKYSLTESLSLSIGGVGGQTLYPAGELPDSDFAQLSVTPVWALGPRSDIGLSSSFYWVDYSNASTIKTFTEMLYWQRMLSETLTLKAGAGVMFSSIDYTTLTTVVRPPVVYIVRKPGSASDTGPIFAVDLKKDWTERFSTTFSGSREQYNDANARSFDKTSFKGSAKFLFSELTTFYFDAKYDLNTQTSEGIEKINYYILIPAVQRNLSEDLALKFAGSYEHQVDSDFGGVSGTEASTERFRAWAELTYKWPRFLSTH